MAAVSIVEYIHDLKKAGFTDQQSEVQARKLEQVIVEVKSELKNNIKQELHLDDLVRNKDLDLAIEKVRKDLELGIEKLRYETLKFTIWTGVAVVMSTAGMLAKGFHWF
ncbi:MAG: hypothetical protein NTW08_08225 [Gammaproteobacteria bacterium]|nr:hypothetical protein [Gammaproteobacteria bacterium]